MESKVFAVASLLVVIFLTSTNLVEGQLHKDGACPSVTTQADLNLENFFGSWFVYAKYPHYYYKDERCAHASYTLVGNDKVSINLTQITAKNGLRFEEETATITGNGVFESIFRANIFASVKHTFKIIATDYSSYAVMYRCQGTSKIHDDYVWVLSRDQVPSKDAVKAAKDAMLAQGLSVNELAVSDQTNCQ